MRSAATYLLLACCAGTGCMSMPSWWERPKPAPPAVVATSARPLSAVSAEQITEHNAREMARALLDELDRDAQAESLPSGEMPAGDPKAGNRTQH